MNGATDTRSMPAGWASSAKVATATASTKMAATFGAMAGTMEPRRMYSSCQP
ncbi:hypothetical protein D9M71_833470 [compost metagenome]